MKPPILARRVVLSLAAVGALVACEDVVRTDVELTGLQAGLTRAQYEALPDSVRFAKESDASPGEAEGVAVDVVLKIDGRKGIVIPLGYALHDARTQRPLVSRRLPVAADAELWTRRGRLWLPVPAPGRYYVQVVLADSAGTKTEGLRTQEFALP